MPDADASRKLARELKALLDGPLAPQDKDAAWQDSLDLLAVAGGTKPAALIGCGYEAGPWLAAIGALAVAEELAVRMGGMPWLVRDEFAGLPEWYAEPVRKGWESAAVLTACRPQEAARFGAATALISCEEEATLLAYPVCCVTDHHARRRVYHDLMIELIAARCDSTEERRRFADADVMPSLRGDADERRLEEALQGEALAYAGFVPCPACAQAGAQGAAGKVDAAMRTLATANGFAPKAEG